MKGSGKCLAVAENLIENIGMQIIIEGGQEWEESSVRQFSPNIK